MRVGTGKRPAFEDFLDASSKGVRIWARAAAEWSLDRGLESVTPIAMAATVPGCEPFWGATAAQLIRPPEGKTIEAIQIAFDAAAEALLPVMNRTRTTGSLSWSEELSAVWASALSEYTEESGDDPLRTEWIHHRQHTHIWELLLKRSDFRSIHDTVGVDLELGGRVGIQQFHSFANELRESLAASLTGVGMTRDQALDRAEYRRPQPNRADFGGFLSAPDPELRAWAACAARWAESHDSSSVTTASLGATIANHTFFWHGFLHKALRFEHRLLRPVLQKLELAAEIESNNEIQRMSDCQNSDCRWSPALRDVWSTFCRERPTYCFDTSNLDQNYFWKLLLSSELSRFSVVLGESGIDVQATRTALDNWRDPLRDLADFLDLLGGADSELPRKRPSSGYCDSN